jgi:CDP-glucose 4,6-dehydratase
VAERELTLEGLAVTAGGRWSSRRVLVTGATGMIGSWLVKELLRADAHVVAFVLDHDPRTELVRSGDAARCNVVNGRVESLHALERAINVHEVDTVFHLAAQTLVEVAHRNPLDTWESNVRGTYNVLEACRVHGSLVRRVVVASSDKAYGDSEELPYTERHPLRARYPYEVSKACADLIAQSYHHTYGLPVAIARCGNVYGGGDVNWSRIVPGTIRSLLRGERPVVRSDGTFVRDYVYVKDVARAYMDLAEALEAEPEVAGEAFNFSDESPLTVLELVAAIQTAVGSELAPLIEDRAAGEIHDQILAAGKAREMLGWRPRYDLEAGLAETVEWYREFLAVEPAGAEIAT